ncbi:MAG: flippase [Bacteroidota bacterium]|nr:flippase [Bacteroidota bacterium]
MDSALRIKRNSFFSFLSSFVRLFTNFLLFVGIARIYGPEAFGQYTIAHTYLILFYIFADFGFDLLLTTEIARSPDCTSELVQRFLPLKMIFALGSIVLMTLIAAISNFSPPTQLLMMVLSISIIGNSVTSFFFALFKGHEILFEETRTSFFQNIFLLIGLFILGLLHVPLIYIALLFACSKLIGVILIVPRTSKIAKLDTFKISFTGWRKTFKQGLPFGIHLLFGTLYFQLDTILLAYWKDDISVGFYQPGMKLIVLILVIPDVLISALLPTLVRLHSENRERWIRLNTLLGKTLMFIGLPFSVSLFVYADEIIRLVYGSGNFIESIPILRIFAFILFIRFASETFALILTTSKQQTIRMYIVVAVTFMNFLLNAYAIPKYGIQGAALVSLITNAVAGILYIIAVSVKSFGPIFLFGIRQILVTGITIIMVISFIALGIHSLVLGLIIMMISYVLIVYFIGYSIEDRSLLFAFKKII